MLYYSRKTSCTTISLMEIQVGRYLLMVGGQGSEASLCVMQGASMKLKIKQNKNTQDSGQQTVMLAFGILHKYEIPALRRHRTLYCITSCFILTSRQTINILLLLLSFLRLTYFILVYIPGCSLLILNVFIFALVYYQRDKRRAEMLKNAQQQNSESSLSSKYGEPPELLKSNSTTATSLHMSTSQGQLHPLQISQQHSSDSTASCHSRHGGQHSYVSSPISEATQKQLAQAAQQQQLSLSQRGILLNPSQTHQQHLQQFHHGQGHYPPQMLAVATLPRSNGGIGVPTNTSGLPKPPPPPRSFANFSTLPHNINKSNQNLSSNFDELKV